MQVEFDAILNKTKNIVILLLCYEKKTDLFLPEIFSFSPSKVKQITLAISLSFEGLVRIIDFVSRTTELNKKLSISYDQKYLAITVQLTLNFATKYLNYLRQCLIILPCQKYPITNSNMAKFPAIPNRPATRVGIRFNAYGYVFFSNRMFLFIYIKKFFRYLNWVFR